MSKLNSLSNLIQGRLNDIAVDLGHEIVFRVTDSEQTFDDFITEMEYEVGNNIKFTPVLLKRLFATKEEDYVYGKYIETYRLEVYGYQYDKNALEAIFDAYTLQENQDDYEILDNTQIKKNHGSLTFVGVHNAKSGTNRHFIHFTYEFTWDYVIGSVISDASRLFIDNVEIDFLGLAYQNDKVLIPNIAYGTNVLPSANGRTYAITFPVLKGTTSKALKNQELFDDITLNRYNKTHTLKWVVDDYKEVTLDVVVRGGSVAYNRDDLVSFVVTFEQALPRTVVRVDDADLPVLSFNFSREYNVESIVKVTDVEAVQVSTGFSVVMRIAHNGTTVSNTLLNNIINNQLGTEHTINITIGELTATYDVVLVNGVYQFEQTAELLYEVTFVKVV